MALTFLEEQLRYSDEATLPRNTTPEKEENQTRKNYCLPFIVLWVIALIVVAPAPGEAIAGFRLYEIAKYYTMVPTTCVSQQLIMNKKTWDAFPPDIQQAIMSVSGESGAIRFGGGCFDRAWGLLPEKAKSAGKDMITYVPPKEEMNRWIEKAGKPLWETWIKKMESAGYPNARKIQEEAIRLVKEYGAGKTDQWRTMFP